MSKKIKGLVFGGVLVVLLAVALVFLLKTQPTKDNTASVAESVTVSLIDKNSGDLKDITVENKKGGFKISKYEGEFVVEGLEKYERYTDNYDQIIQYAIDLDATQEVESSPEDIKKYGLEKPSAKAKISYKDGEVFELLIGDLAPDETSYYVKDSEKDAVYLLSDAKTERFLDSKLDYISPIVTTTDNFETEVVTNEDGEQEEQAITPDLKRFDIIRNDLDEVITFEPVKEHSSDEQIAALECDYQLTSPYNATLDSEDGSEPITLFYAITAESVVDININEDKYAKYGFKNPTMKLQMQAKKKKYSHTVLFGDKTKDENGNVAYYCIIDSRDVVYRVLASDLMWLTLNVNELLSDYIINPILDDVSIVEIDVNNKNYKFSISGKSGTSTPDSLTSISEEDIVEDTTQVLYNGKKINKDKFRSFYIFLNSLTAIGSITDEPSGKPVMTISYTYRDSSRKTDVVKLIPYGNSKVAVNLNGDTKLVARSAYVDRAIENIQKVINNKEINAYW